MSESLAQFEQRKADHIRLALDDKTEARGLSGLDRIELIHEALPELNFSEINLKTKVAGLELQAPFLISSMTAGHAAAPRLNSRLAVMADKHGWAMGVGSQRKELSDPEASREWREVRKQAPTAILFGNLGLSQVLTSSVDQVRRLLENLEAQALFVHTNPLQEALQKEGTPQFRGGIAALQNLCEKLSVPVILKEVGCGMSAYTLLRLQNVGLYAVDIAGLGGTHWGRIEGARADSADWQKAASETFADWGLSTLQSLLAARQLRPSYKIWASGGIRSGLDAAKSLALGAELVGVAKPILQAALQGDEALEAVMQRLEHELKIALFCTGCQNIASLQNVSPEREVWQWKNK